MAGGITNYAQLNAANTMYEAKFVEIFGGGPKGTWNVFCEKVSAKAKFLELDIIASFPRVREWVGSKVFKELRAYKQTITLTTYEATTRMSRRDVEYDVTGVVGRALSLFVQQNAFMYDDLAWAKLISNPTGYDGVSLLNDAHTQVASTGNADNLTTSAITYETFRAGVQAMEQVTDEDGKPLGIYPTALFVGPKQRRKALEITGAARPQSVDSSGAYDTTSNVVGAAAIPNAYQGEVDVYVTPWITGNEWFLFDLSKPARPIMCFEARGPVAIPAIEMSSDGRFLLDEYRWSLEADVVFDAGMWQTAYGSVTN